MNNLAILAPTISMWMSTVLGTILVIFGDHGDFTSKFYKFLLVIMVVMSIVGLNCS